VTYGLLTLVLILVRTILMKRLAVLLSTVGLVGGWRGAVAGFILFRAFDLAKPFPARACERLNGGVGIIADGVVAGLYGNVALRAALLLLPSWR
jgi:phosphatidylglycerophosphatase A